MAYKMGVKDPNYFTNWDDPPSKAINFGHLEGVPQPHP